MIEVRKGAIEGRRVVVISPVRDEERLLPGAIASLVAQSVRPVLWIIVDDGSRDRTAAIAAQAACEHGWIRVVARRDRGMRELGGGVVRAFNDGLAAVDVPFDFIAKMDADLTFGPRYLEGLLERFEADPRLGSASGKVFRPEPRGPVEEFMIDEMVAGQWKLYRRACFEAIGGLVPAVMWDGIDFHRARQAGFRTRSYADPQLRILHHRLMGSSDRSVYRGRLRLGRGQWFLGSHPLYMLASAALRMLEKPFVVGGALMLLGYLQSMLAREARYADETFRAELHRWQLRRLFRLVAAGEVR